MKNYNNMTNNNTGYRNTGHYNIGDYNTGDKNTGHWNTGHYNTGHYNTGDKNTGHWNTGHWNTGHYNTGDKNTGHWNTGHWNSCNYSTGFFNTQEQPFYMFNKPVKEVSRESIEAYLNISLTEWILPEDMSEQEKKDNPSWVTSEGYLKQRTFEEACNIAWQRADKETKERFLGLPNFDPDIFFEITGIDVKQKEELEKAEEKYNDSARALEEYFYQRGQKGEIGATYQDFEIKNRYYQARKRYEELKNKNNN